jgi:hypothetical protein
VNRTPIAMTIIGAMSLAVLGGMALAAQDKYTVKVPGGLAFSEFKGYEGWQVVATSQNDRLVAVILANPTMIKAYQAGVPTARFFPTAPRWRRSIGCRRRTNTSRIRRYRVP